MTYVVHTLSMATTVRLNNVFNHTHSGPMLLKAVSERELRLRLQC